MQRRSLAQIDLNLLVALDALLHERSVTRAGNRLALSQPTMSGALARLRRLFDDEILVRDGATMHRTPLAETLIGPVSEILASIEQTIETATRFDPQRDARTFRLIATDYALLVLIRPTLQRLPASGPHVRLQVRTTGFIEHAALLHRGEIDLAIVPEPLTRPRSLPHQPILDDRFVGVIWRGNTEVGDRLTIEQLHHLPYLSYRVGRSDSMAHRPLSELGFERAPDIVLESFAVGAQMIRGTRHVTILQERLAKLYADIEELRLIDTPFPTPPLTETMTWHPRATHDPAHRWLRALIQDVAASL